jgi:sulfate transport system permease protein
MAMVHETSRRLRSPTTEAPFARYSLMALAFLFLALFLILPLVAVFIEAFRKGAGEFFASLGDADTMAAIRLTLLVAGIAVPLNLVFGVAAAWAIAKFEFKGKAFLTTLIDLPFSVSPVISGLVYVLAARLAPGSRAMASRSCSPCRASCWPPSSSPSPSSRANSSR